MSRILIDAFDTATYFTITYNANGADSGSVPIDSNQYSSSATVTVLDNTGNLARAGYVFGGWSPTPS
jgi:hypothetical protein